MSKLDLMVGALALGLAGAAHAQLGPWQDGELLVYSVLQNQQQAIYRCDPLTGHGEVLASGLNYTGAFGGMAYEPHRGQLLLTGSFPPDNPFAYKLWALNANGTRVSIPGFDGQVLRALAPTGDGRVFFQRHTSAASIGILEYLDANDVAHPLLDAAGTAPLTYRAEHLVYHAPSNALIGTNSAWWSPQDCVDGMGSIFRIPLSADGTRVGGPITCTSYGGVHEELMTMDFMPGGDLLLTVASGYIWGTNFVRVDPLTLAITGYADPQMGDINGGFYVPQLGKAVLLDDSSNKLRAYAAGQSGLGVELNTDFIVSPGTSGFSPAETLFEVDLSGPGCFGYAGVYGQGTLGTGGIRPTITATGCPNVGDAFTITIENVVGGTSGMLFAGLSPAALPFAGGQLLTFPIVAALPLPVGGAAGVAGAGSVSFPVLLADPALIGVTFYLQGAFSDPAAQDGASLTNGVQVTLG